MKASDGIRETVTTPRINVTPLIDVLLVLLIIFMVITPLEPSRFKAQIPQPPPSDEYPPPKPGTLTLVVTVEKDLSLRLNQTGGMGSAEDTAKLSAELSRIIQERRENHAYREEMKSRIDLPEEMRIEKTVYIKAPRSVGYGAVAKVIDGVKGAGADPIGLQVDKLD
ncbi:MAG TPA: biopolymer transporter ExbD [Pyrinomonadaceae bacterium]|jgi:biopolymer transport protein ExbD